MDFKKYAETQGINATSIKAGRTSMKHMRRAMGKGFQPETPAMRWGKLAHRFILEPDVWQEQALVWDGKVRRGAEWEAFVEEHPDTIDMHVTRSELAELEAMIDAVYANQHAKKLIEESQHEVSIFWDKENVGPCKARIDGIGLGRIGVVELKTTAAIRPRQFFRSAYGLGYHLQLGWYQDAAEHEFDEKAPPVHVVTLESSRPYDVVVYRVPQEILEHARKEADEIAMLWKIAETTNNWPDITDAVLDYELPEYATGQTWKVE